MKNIEIDEELYQYIATSTQFIGESASSILRRLLSLEKPLEKSLDNSIDKSAEQSTAEVDKPHQVVDFIDETPVTEANIVQTEISIKKKSAVQKAKAQNLAHHKDISETVFNYINKEELTIQRGAVGRFLLILAALYRGHAKCFSVVNDISGRDRLYFANSEDELEASGSSTKPRQIPDSPFWVITNSNTTRKKMMLTKVAIALGYNEEDAEKIRELL